jgi:hypothetical protein
MDIGTAMKPMSQPSSRSRTPWKAITIVLALVLGVVVLCAAIVVADFTDLALSLL